MILTGDLQMVETETLQKAKNFGATLSCIMLRH